MWGVDHDGVVPDVMTVGKGVGGGFPLSAVISTDELTKAKPWANPSGSSSSYGGNPLGSAAGLASLEIITRENLVENAERVGRAMLERLRAMKEKHRIIGDVRGKGLLLGLDLVKDRRTKELVSKDFSEGPLPGVPAPGPRRDVLHAGHPDQPAAQHRRAHGARRPRDPGRVDRRPRAGVEARLSSAARARRLMLRGALIGVGHVARNGHLPGLARAAGGDARRGRGRAPGRPGGLSRRLPGGALVRLGGGAAVRRDARLRRRLHASRRCTPRSPGRRSTAGCHVLCEKPLVLSRRGSAGARARSRRKERARSSRCTTGSTRRPSRR